MTGRKAERGANCPTCDGLLMESPADPATVSCVNCGREYDAPDGSPIIGEPKPYNQPALTEAQEVKAQVLAELQALAHEYRPADADFWRKWVRAQDINRMLRPQGRNSAQIRRKLGLTVRKIRGPGDHNPVNYLLISDARRIIAHR